ncbi:MAG: YhbY family RNA-binding protein [Oscillospiraceae bacterium]
MIITSKQRAKLKGLAQDLETLAQFGKGEISPEQLTMVEQMLTKRELIKCRVLETSPYTAGELAELLAEKTGAVAVQAIGSRFVLYRPNRDKPIIKLN